MTALRWELGTDVNASDSADCRPRGMQEMFLVEGCSTF